MLAFLSIAPSLELKPLGGTLEVPGELSINRTISGIETKHRLSAVKLFYELSIAPSLELKQTTPLIPDL